MEFAARRDSGADEDFEDCASPSVVRAVTGRQLGQMSIREMARHVQQRRTKRKGSGRGSKSPQDGVTPAAKRQTTAPATDGSPPPVNLTPEALNAIQCLIDASIAKAIPELKAELRNHEQRISILEGEIHIKDEEIRRLQNEVQWQSQLWRT